MVRYKTNMSEFNEEEKEIDQFGERQRAEYYKPKVGKNLVRVLPPWKPDGLFFKRVAYHQIGSGVGKENKITCPKFTFKKPCKICAHYKRVLESRDEEAAAPYLAKKRYLLNVLDMRAGDGIVYVWETGPQLFRPIYQFIKEMEDDTMLDYAQGYNYKFTRTGERNNTRYKDAMVVPKPFDLTANGYDANELNGLLNDLDATPWRSKDDEIHEFLKLLQDHNSDSEGGSDVEDADDGAPAPRQRAAAKASSRVVDEEEDTPPARQAKPTAGKRRAVADEEDGDPDADDAPPARPARQAANGAAKRAAPPARRAAPLDDEDAPAGDDLVGEDEEIPFG